MTFAANGGSILRGILLGSAYSAGLAIPFLVACPWYRLGFYHPASL